MKNNSKSIITIEMRNVDHAMKLTDALRKFFFIADAGGDTELMHSASDGSDSYESCGIIGHDVRRPIISIEFPDE